MTKMRPKKWNTIKLHAKQRATVDNMGPVYAVMEAVSRGSTNWRGTLVELQETVWDVIDKWDIRRMRALCELFPGIVPKDCAFTADMDGKGNWVIW